MFGIARFVVLQGQVRTPLQGCILVFVLRPPAPARSVTLRYTATTYTRVGTLIVATIYLQLIQNRYMFRSFTVLQCSHQHCVQPVASDVDVVGYL